MTLRYKVVLLISCLGVVSALDNGLTLTPPMGWMQWQRFRCLVDCDAYPDDCISEKLFRTMADHIVDDGYLDAGYKYIMIDDCWASKKRDSEGRLQPDPDRFPSGMKNLSDYIHSKGLKFGIYGDYGTLTCAGYPGSLGYLQTDAETFADWEVDYLKFDGCYVKREGIEEGYINMGQYLNATGRPIVFSCSFPAYQEPDGVQSNYSLAAETCNLWRNWDDIDDSWSSMIGILKWFSSNQDRLIPFAGPGHWNDPDMLLIGNFGLSLEQSKAQMAIWAIMAAPLIMSVDLRTIKQEFRDILLNKDIIAVNQDELGIQGQLVKTKDKIDIWTKPGLPKVDDTYTHAIGFLSQRYDGYPYRLNFTLAELNITNSGGFILKDLYNTSRGETLVRDDELLFIRVKPSGGEILLATPTTVEATKVSQL